MSMRCAHALPAHGGALGIDVVSVPDSTCAVRAYFGGQLRAVVTVIAFAVKASSAPGIA